MKLLLSLLTYLVLNLEISLFSLPLDVLPPYKYANNKPGMPEIDATYMLRSNAQSSPQLANTIRTLETLHIYPFLPSPLLKESFNSTLIGQVGLQFTSNMSKSRWASQLVFSPSPQTHGVFLSKEMMGQIFFSTNTTLDTIVHSLNFLSIIKNAYAEGFNRIWILEEAVKFERDPYVLSSLIKQLDETVGPKEWDILYTDLDTHDSSLYQGYNDFVSPIKGIDLAWFWRPDIAINSQKLKFREKISADFLKIGSRMRTYSLIINRPGIEKIINFYKYHGLYAPLDHELAQIPDIHLYSLLYNVVTYNPPLSLAPGVH